MVRQDCISEREKIVEKERKVGKVGKVERVGEEGHILTFPVLDWTATWRAWQHACPDWWQSIPAFRLVLFLNINKFLLCIFVYSVRRYLKIFGKCRLYRIKRAKQSKFCLLFQHFNPSFLHFRNIYNFLTLHIYHLRLRGWREEPRDPPESASALTDAYF